MSAHSPQDRTPDPLVTAVIPTHNRPELAPRAARSALRQSYPMLEVMIVDDGSDPPFAPPPDLIADPRVTVLRLDPAAGAGGARNAGARAGRGTCLAFLDDDDEWGPTKIERQVRALMESDPTVAVVECGYEAWIDDRLLYRYVPTPGRDFALSVLEHNRLVPSSMLIKRSAFEELGGFDPTLKRIEDTDFVVRASERFGLATVPDILVHKREGHVDPTDDLRACRLMFERFGPRIEALPADQRSRVAGTHLFNIGLFAARSGDRAAARAAYWRAWRTDPRRVLALVHLVRTLVGERVWRGMTRPFHGVRRWAGTVRRRAASSRQP